MNNHKQRVDYARELAKMDPNLTYRALNERVRARHGKGITDSAAGNILTVARNRARNEETNRMILTVRESAIDDGYAKGLSLGLKLTVAGVLVGAGFGFVVGILCG